MNAHELALAIPGELGHPGPGRNSVAVMPREMLVRIWADLEAELGRLIAAMGLPTDRIDDIRQEGLLLLFRRQSFIRCEGLSITGLQLNADWLARVNANQLVSPQWMSTGVPRRQVITRKHHANLHMFLADVGNAKAGERADLLR